MTPHGASSARNPRPIAGAMPSRSRKLAVNCAVMQVDRGFDATSVVAVDVSLPASRYDAGRVTRFHDELQATAGFALAGLALVCLGVFGTVSQRTVRRRREFAIRLALGATRGSLVGQVCAEGMRPVAAGLAAGLIVALAAARFIEALLFGVAPVDTGVIAGAALAVLGLGAGACLVPAVRALGVPPARTLRTE